jgi:hypothetical protein
LHHALAAMKQTPSKVIISVTLAAIKRFQPFLVIRSN